MKKRNRNFFPRLAWALVLGLVLAFCSCDAIEEALCTARNSSGVCTAGSGIDANGYYGSFVLIEWFFDKESNANEVAELHYKEDGSAVYQTKDGVSKPLAPEDLSVMLTPEGFLASGTIAKINGVFDTVFNRVGELLSIVVGRVDAGTQQTPLGLLSRVAGTPTYFFVFQDGRPSWTNLLRTVMGTNQYKFTDPKNDRHWFSVMDRASVPNAPPDYAAVYTFPLEAFGETGPPGGMTGGGMPGGGGPDMRPGVYRDDQNPD